MRHLTLSKKCWSVPFQHPLDTHLYQPSIYLVLKIHQLIGHLPSRGSFLVDSASCRFTSFAWFLIWWSFFVDISRSNGASILWWTHTSCKIGLPLEQGEITHLEQVTGHYVYCIFTLIYIYIIMYAHTTLHYFTLLDIVLQYSTLLCIPLHYTRNSSYHWHLTLHYWNANLCMFTFRSDIHVM